MHVTMHIEEDDFIRSSQGSWARTAPQILRSGITPRHYATFYGLSACYLVTGLKDTYVYLTGYVRFMCGHPMGLCGFHMGIGTSIRSRADAVRAWEFLYDQWCRALRVRLGPGLATGSLVFDPYGTRELLGSFM